MSTTVNPQEIAHFSAFSHQWWDEQGPFKILHQLNPTRLGFIKDCVEHYHGPAKIVLDTGCGGGLVAEPLARQGFQVTAIDATIENIAAAQEHAQMMGLEIDYRHTTVEDLAATGAKFDVITALEIVEHVADVPLFLKSCSNLLAPGGILIVSTLNRTPLSFLGGIVAAEYVLRWVPRGTHDWKQFIKPSELVNQLAALDMAPCDLKGLHYSPFKNQWSLSNKLQINYMGCFKTTA
jgi:2-polyprenyl-6-hydroxyphenyl methylase/3-demethylubiquinone-9 3-methyltransferase